MRPPLPLQLHQGMADELQPVLPDVPEGDGGLMGGESERWESV